MTSKTPGATKFGNYCRDILFHEVTTMSLEPETASLLYFTSHLESWVNIIEPALKEGKIVISDRWDAYSGIAYGIHGGVRPINPAVQDLRQHSGPQPDLVVHLYGDPEILLPRAQSSRRSETHQSGKIWNTIEKQQRIQEEYFKLFSTSVFMKAYGSTHDVAEHLAEDFYCYPIQSDNKTPQEISDLVWNRVYRQVRRHFDL